LGVRILPSAPLAKHLGQHPKVGRPADAEHPAWKDRTLRVPVGVTHSSNCRHTEVVGYEVGDFPVPRSLIRRLAKLLDDCDTSDDRESQSPDVLKTGHPPFAVHRQEATRVGDGSERLFLKEPEEGDAAGLKRTPRHRVRPSYTPIISVSPMSSGVG